MDAAFLIFHFQLNPYAGLEVLHTRGIMVGVITFVILFRYSIWYFVMAIFGPRVGHEALFDEVCRFHDIDRKTKTLLQSVAKKYQLPRPAEIFIESETLIRALNDTELTEENADLQKLYDTWFIEQSLANRRK